MILEYLLHALMIGVIIAFVVVAWKIVDNTQGRLRSLIERFHL